MYADAHSDDVSTLSFHPSMDEIVLSGAVDGLTSTIDARITDEDDAILYTANVGASLSRVGWMGLPGKGWQSTYALTDMETLSIYDASNEVRASQSFRSNRTYSKAMQMSLTREFGDIRNIENAVWQTHYVIDCQGTEDGLAVFSGQRE